jgi:ATP-dependent DNA helicase PIF1
MTTFDTAFRQIAERAPIVMVLGGAGTGKTTFLHELRRRAGVRQVFLAPTGVAALQLGGQIPSSASRPGSSIPMK